jgi:hypothetical protein
LISNLSNTTPDVYPEVTITPITPEEDPQDPLSFSFTPSKANVCVRCPVNSGWTDAQVEELVSYIHS